MSYDCQANVKPARGWIRKKAFSVVTEGSATIKRGLRNIHLTNERERKGRRKGVREAFVINGHFAHPVTGEMNA